MNAIKLIYNPLSGDRNFKNSLDACAEVFQRAGYETHLCRASGHEDLDAAVKNIDCRYKYVVVAGGDGSVNLVINALKRHGINIPLGIIPAGTANDFATYLKMPKDPGAAAMAIVTGHVIQADLGLVNGRYFVNVCSVGALTAVGQQVAGTRFKAAFGKIAYYVRGIGQLPHLEPIPLRIETPSQSIEDDFIMCIILNSSGAGGFDRLSRDAKIDDGLLDFIGFRAMTVRDMAAVFMKLLNGDHLADPNILFMREKDISISSRADSTVITDTDGEPGTEMPLSITCEAGCLPLVVPVGF